MKLKWILFWGIIATCFMILLAPIEDYTLEQRLAGCILALIFWSPALIAFVEDV